MKSIITKVGTALLVLVALGGAVNACGETLAEYLGNGGKYQAFALVVKYEGESSPNL